MAVVTLKSTRISNIEAVVQTLDYPNVNHGRKRAVCATLEAVSGDSIASIYRMVRLHSSWRVTSIILLCDAITTCAADLGLYQTIASPTNGGLVASVSCYATAASLATASVTGIELAYEFKDVANIQRQVWQDAGATADTNRWYDLAFTLTAAAGSAGTISLEVTYVGND